MTPTTMRSPLVSHPRSNTDGSFPRYAEEEVRSPPMCGQGMLTKILRKSPGRQQQVSPEIDGNQSKSCLGPGKKLGLYLNSSRYEEVTESVHSRETESISSSEKSKGDAAQEINSSENVLPYTIQFDPQELQEVMAGEPKKDPKTLNRAKQRVVVGRGFRPNLPVVTEENSASFDDSECKDNVRGTSPREDTSAGDKQGGSVENNGIVIGMRDLIIKQQKALTHLSEENGRYRREIRSYQTALLRMKEEQTSQKDKIDLLTIEKETFQSEAKWLRNQRKKTSQSPRPEPKALASLSGDLLTRQFQMLMTNTPESPTLHVEAINDEEEEGDGAGHEFQQFKKNLMADKIVSNILSDAMGYSDRMTEVSQTRDDVGTPTRTRDSGHSQREGIEQRDQHQQHDASMLQSSEVSFESRSVHTDTSKGSKEEVALFKTRLESIQQRRRQRETGRHRTSPNVVRFDQGVKKL